VATLLELQVHLGRLAVILWNYGAEFPQPTLDPYEDGSYGFEFEAALPGTAVGKPATIKMAEAWEPARNSAYIIAEYGYDFIEYPLSRRRAFHRHDEDDFLGKFGVAVHEHCEEVLGKPTCEHYMGLPVNAYEAVQRFATLWGQPTPLGCAALRCVG
jgi:hypothetical protein